MTLEGMDTATSIIVSEQTRTIVFTSVAVMFELIKCLRK